MLYFLIHNVPCLSKKRGVELFVITSSTVTNFENSFTVGNSNKLSIK